MGGNGRRSPSLKGMVLTRRKVTPKVNAKPTAQSQNIVYTDFGGGYGALQKSTAWFMDSNNSNIDEMINGYGPNSLDGQEVSALKYYSGNAYTHINSAMYTQEYDEMDSGLQKIVTNMKNGINKSVLLNGCKVTRACDFKIFGAGDNQKMSIDEIRNFFAKNGGGADKNILENKGFLSAGANNHGAEIDGSGLKIHFDVPPSVGAGMYINPISLHKGATENEFLFNSYSNFKFDLNSLKYGSDGNIHINAQWIGKGDMKKKWKH